jgi:hypothetical protein
MPTTGMRPKGSDGPLYHPERDLAYITPTLMANAMGTLVLDSMRPELKDFAQSSCISQESLNKAVESFAKAQQLYVSTEKRVESAKEALELTGFYHLPLNLRMLLTSAIGEAVAGAWFVSVRDVTRVDQDSPAITQMAEMLAAANAVARLHVDPVAADEYAVKVAELELKVSNRDGWLREANQKSAEASRLKLAAQHEVLVLQDAVQQWTARTRWQRWKDWWDSVDFSDYVEDARRRKALG